uniref:phospholipase A2 n=1 Tax=Sphaeramia orbicularis TaxID=375764 RepID=A0A673C3S1_9TELE
LIRCAFQFVFTSLWLILLKVQDVVGSDHLCLRSSPAEDRQTRVTFLRQNAGVRSLYLTVWSEDLRLVTCEINTNPLVTGSYDTFCKSSSSESQEINQRFNISIVLSPDAPCTPDAPSAQKFTKSAGEGKVRRKRSWIFPGTLWCGHGSRAGGYDQLGMFEAADRCCREHDHCNHIIPGMTVNYGVFNPNFYTVSHCDCDQRFRQCLLSVNDTISSMVGYSYFNILRVPCFELKRRRQCTKMYWWGKCKVTKEAAYATFKNSRPYNKSDIETKFEDKARISNTTSSKGQHVTESPVTKAPRKFPRDERRCVTKDPPRGDTFVDRRRGKGCKRRRKLSTVVSSQKPPLSSLHTVTPTVTTHVSNATISDKLVLNKKKRVKNKSNRKDDLLLCGSLKHLDKCKYKIPPLEKKYDLQNFEAKTAYHCDCTNPICIFVFPQVNRILFYIFVIRVSHICLCQWFLTLLEVLNPTSFICAFTEPFFIKK